MSDYAQITLFTPKDALITGNPLKLVRGSEIDAEFAAIGVAIATKYDSTDFANPTGTVGLAAVNGVASTLMRSDAAPVLSQAIAPTWSGQHTWSLSLRAPDGLVGTPGYTFTNDPDTGIWRAGANDMRFSTAGSTKLSVDSANVAATVPFLAANGAVGTPGYSFSSDPDTGIYRASADVLAFATGGVVRGFFDANALYLPNGTISLPAISFMAEGNTGIYRVGTGNMRVTAAGVDVWGFASSAGVALNQPFGVLQAIIDGSVGTPMYSFNNDPDTGLYRSGANILAVAVGGQQGPVFQQNGGVGQLAAQDGLVGFPSVTFINDADSGMYSGGANNIRFTTGGVKALEIDSSHKLFDQNGIELGYKQIPRSTTATTLVAADLGKCVAITAAINIPISVFSAGDAISIYNDSAGALNITISAGTLRLGGTTTTGTRSLAARGVATLWFNVGGATPEVIATGNVS